MPPRFLPLPILAICSCLAVGVGCRSSKPPRLQPTESLGGIYRFDDRISEAAVSGPHAPSSVSMAEPVVWHFDDQKATWDLLRGRMGFKPGQLVLKGEGSTPVMVSPARPGIDWSRYEAIRIRMISEGGREIKIKLGGQEMRQQLAGPMVWKVYRFDLKAGGATFTTPLAIMPTDDRFAPVAIDFIELVPKKTEFKATAGRAAIGKQEEYRNAVFAHAGASLAYPVEVPRAAALHFGLGISGPKPVTFRVLAGPSKTELFSKTMADPARWEDAEVDLAAYAGQKTTLVFETASDAADAVGFWANPLMAAKTAKRRPNVLLYTVCTLRPDHTSLYGYSRDTTPFLKELGASGVVFDDCQAQASWTKPSVASLMTSLHAYAHGLVNNTDTIPAGATTLAAELRKAGYVTASIVANPFAGRASGLDRGFDYMLEYPVVQRYRDEAADRATDSAAINRAILPWLERRRDEPFFLFVLSADPHAPYRPPAEFEKLFANPTETPQFDRDAARLAGIRFYGGGATVSRAEIRAKGIDPDAYIRRAIDRYDGEIANNDSSIRALIARVKRLGLLDDTLVVVASDHGEEFWEHGFGAHGHTLYSELIHAALLFWNPKLLPRPRRVAEPVQLIDVMPTLMELLGLGAPAGLEGQSLVPLLQERPFRRGEPVMSTKLALPQATPGGAVPENATDTIARLDADWKLIFRPQGPRTGLREVELYDRRADRADRTDVAAGHPEISGRLKLETVQWIEREKGVRQRIGPGGTNALDRRTTERLRSLGYLGGGRGK